MTRSLSVLALACLSIVGCGPSDTKLEALKITVTTPSGWSVAPSKFSNDGDAAEIKKSGKTYGFISPEVLIPLAGDSKAWPKEGKHTFEQFKAALAPLNPTDETTFERGFGARFEKQGKPHFFYVIQLGDRELQCSSNDWIAAGDVPAAIEVCTSIRP